MNDKNMELWNQVCETDPATIKYVNARGGFHAIDAQSQIKRATELWGPYGGEWGVRDLHYSQIAEHKTVGSGTVQDEHLILCVKEINLIATFYYPGGEFQLGVDIEFKVGNESRKKLLTDLLTKALSRLGFNSDVFENKFADNKYLNEMKEKFAKEPNPEDLRRCQIEAMRSTLVNDYRDIVKEWLPDGTKKTEAHQRVDALVSMAWGDSDHKLIPTLSDEQRKEIIDLCLFEMRKGDEDGN